MSWGTSGCSSSGEEILPPPDSNVDVEAEFCLLRGCGSKIDHSGGCGYCKEHLDLWNQRANMFALSKPQFRDHKKKPICACRGCFCPSVYTGRAKQPPQGLCSTNPSSEDYPNRYCQCREKRSCPNARTPEHFALARQQIFSIACFGNTTMASVLATNYRIMQTAVLFIPCFNNNDLQIYRERREKKSSNQNVKPRYLNDKIVFLDTLLGSKSEKSESQQFLCAVAASLES